MEMGLSKYGSIEEFFSTESKHYEKLSQLSRIIALFTVPLEENRELPENSRAYKELQDLFANPLMEADAKKELLEQLKEFKKTLDEYLSVIKEFATRCNDKKDDITVADVKDFASDRTIQCLVAVLIAAQSVKYLLETKYKVENAMSLSTMLILPTQRATRYGMLAESIKVTTEGSDESKVKELLGINGLARSAEVADALVLLLQNNQQLLQLGINILEYSGESQQQEQIVEKVLDLHKEERKALKHLGPLELEDENALKKYLGEALELFRKNQQVRDLASKHLSLMEKKENVSGLSYLRNMMNQAGKRFSFSSRGKTQSSSPPKRETKGGTKKSRIWPSPRSRN